MVMLTKAPVAEPHKRSAAESSDCPSKKAARIDDAEEEDGRSEADRARKKANIETLFGRGSRSGGAQTNYVRRESIAPQLFTDVPALCEPFKDPSLVVSTAFLFHSTRTERQKPTRAPDAPIQKAAFATSHVSILAPSLTSALQLR